MQDEDDLYDNGCRQGVGVDVELDIRDVVDVLEVNNVAHDVFEEKDRL